MNKIDNPGYLDTVEVIGSIPVAPTNEINNLGGPVGPLFSCVHKPVHKRAVKSMDVY